MKFAYSMILKLWNTKNVWSHNLKSDLRILPDEPFQKKNSYDVPELHKIRRSSDFTALKLGKGSSGSHPNEAQAWHDFFS